MTKHEWLELGAFAVGGIALFVILSRSGGTTATTASGLPDTTPGYLAYNKNNNIPPTDQSNLNLPGVNSTNSPCNCGASNNLITFSDAGSFAQTLGQQLGFDLQGYESAVLDQYPEYVRQFFNAQQAADNSSNAITRFASFGGGS